MGLASIRWVLESGRPNIQNLVACPSPAYRATIVITHETMSMILRNIRLPPRRFAAGPREKRIRNTGDSGFRRPLRPAGRRTVSIV